MDVSAVSALVPEPSSPSKSEKSASGAKQFEQLLAAGVGGAQAATGQDQPPVGRAAPRPERRDSAAAPVKDRPKQADKADKADDDEADRDRVREKRAKAADQADAADDDKPAAGQDVISIAAASPAPAETAADGGAQTQTDGDAGDAAAPDTTASGSDSTGDAAALAPTVAAPAPTVAAPTASATPTPTAPAPVTGDQPSGAPNAPALASPLPVDRAGAAPETAAQTPAAADTPSPAATPAAATPAAAAPASDLASAAAKLAAAVAASSAGASKPASSDSSAASMANAGKTTASEALAQVNQQSADAVVRIGTGGGTQDPGQQGLGGSLGRGNGTMVALDRAPLTKAGPTVATETLLFSQLEQAAQQETSVEGPAPLPQTSALGETGLMASPGASATAAPTSAAAPTAPAAPPPARPVTPVLLPLIDQVLPHLSQAGNADGTGRYTINLRPPELGKVQVTLKVGADGHVAASIMADRQDTLSLLQRDSHLLEQALSDAGLTTGNGDLQFSLNGDSQGTGFEDGPGSYNAGVAAATPIDDPEAPAAPRQIAGLSLVDLHV